MGKLGCDRSFTASGGVGALDWFQGGRSLRKLILAAVLVLSVPLLAASSDQKSDKDGTPGWTRTGGTYHTTQVLPAGTQVRVRVGKYGKKAELMLVEWHGGKKKDGRYDALQTWPGKSLRRGQVHTVKLPRAMQIGVRVGLKGARDPSGMRAHYGFHELRFGDGWRVDVRVVDPTF